MILNASNKNSSQGDMYNTVGCLTRIAKNLTQALCVLNGKKFLAINRLW
jgi:hypothetical protein